ncbi:MAG: cysteine desulfurase [Gemmatimonadetes bacterium]|nr:cysteine desulfurase [Gemmatimonadota bacterium]
MNPVYLDHAATTPIRDEVRAAMEPFSSEVFGNPSSLHRWGRAAEAALEDARDKLASAIGAKPTEVRFVRGGTESDNLAIMGSCAALKAAGGAPTMAVTSIEHAAVLESAAHLETTGVANVVTLEVTPQGELDLDELGRVVERSPAVVSVMWVNNETGIVLPVAEAAALARAAGATMHTDASQALGKVPVHVGEVPVDLLTATGHKINGPKGAGILFVREGTALSPLLHGGGQEHALRPGTEDVAGAVGLAVAVALAVDEQEATSVRLRALRDALEHGLADAIPGIRINGSGATRAPHITSVGIDGVRDGEAILMGLDLEGVAASGGSACQSGTGRSSHVIAALYGADDPLTTVRFSFGRTSEPADIQRAIEVTTQVVERLRAAS